MLLRVSFIFFWVFSFISTFANDSTLSWQQWKKSWKKKEINTHSIDIKREKNLIEKIEVLDVRSDTERVGIYTNDFHYPCEVVFDAPLSVLMNEELTAGANGKTILLVVRNFWINEVQYIEGRPKSRQSITGDALPSTKLTCSIDAFIKDGEKYFPLTQVDTIFTDKQKVAFSARYLTERALIIMQNKLEEAILSKRYLAKKQTDKEFIENVYNRRFKIAALTDSIFPKGIYYTWDQFKNNQPADKDFSIRSNKGEPPSLFINENGNEILTRNVFAVSDGYNLYKVHHGFVFPI